MISMIRRQRFWTLGLLLFAVAVVSVLFSQNFLSLPLAEGSHGGTHELSGYDWSSNIGWINFKGTWFNPITGASGDYGVELTSDGKFVNYAWSSNIGWISFKDNTGTPPSGTAGVFLTGSQVTGWARACSVFQSSCAGALKSDSERGGWDGWIKMNPMNNPAYDVRLVGNQLRGFAWGSDVVGWISFCPAADLPGDVSGACVTVDSLNVRCTANGSENGGVVNINPPSTDTVTWEASVISGGTPNYTFCWGNGLADECTLGESVHDYVTGVVLPEHSVNRTYTSPDPLVKANVTVTDSAGKTGNAICSIEVKDLTNPKLTVYVNGGVIDGVVNAVNVDPDPNTGSIDGCHTNDSSCNGTYTLVTPSTAVTLTALPGDNPNTTPPNEPYAFTWGTGDCESNPTPDTCTVTMDEDESVSVTFNDQTSVVPTFTITPGIISIEFHNAGQSAQSNESILTLTSSEATELRVDSFKSFTGKSIKQIIDEIPGNHLPVECLLGGVPGSCANTPPNRVNVNPGGSTTFSVLVPEKLIEILNNSPYFIKLRAGNTLVPIRFEYRVRDIRP